MAPINLPNGAEVSEIVLPNGATASEVIAPDGSTVFIAIPDSGVSHWEFEQDVTDSWGPYDGTDNTSAGYSTNSAVGTYAKSFDTVDDYVDLGADIGIGGSSAFSFSIWVYPRNTSNTIIWGNSGSDGNDENFLRWTGSSWQVYLNNGGTKLVSGTLSTNQYQMMTITYDDAAGSAILYKNDANMVVSGGSSGAITTSAATWKFGDDRLGVPFDAELDDTRRYDKALSATEVSNLYNTGSISG